MRKKIKSAAISGLKVLFAAALISWLVKSGRLDFAEMKNLLNPNFIFVALALTAVTILFTSERWRGILRAQGFEMGIWQTIKLSLVGLFFNFVIPGGVGGDVVKGYYVARNNPNHRMRSVVTIAMDRLLGLFSMLIMALFVMVMDWNRVTTSKPLFGIFLFLSIIFVGFMVFWILIFSRRTVASGWLHRFLIRLPKAEKALNLYESFAGYKDSKMTFFKTIIWSLLAQSVSILLFIYIGHCLGYSGISFHTYFFVVPIGSMITAIPISPAGVGVGQAAFSYLFSIALGETTTLGPATITAVQIINFCVGLLGAVVYIGLGKPHKAN